MNGWEQFLHTAEDHETSVAIYQGEQTLTFRELIHLAKQQAAIFRHRGVKSGDRCIIYAENSIRLAATPLALWQLGACPVFVADDAPESHLKYASDLTSCRCIVVNKNSILSPDQENTTQFVTLDELCSPALTISDDTYYFGRIANNEDLLGSIVFTSGSTGLPKGVMQSHHNLITRCLVVGKAMGYQEGDLLLCPVPWSHDYGWGHLLSLYFVGLPMVLPEIKGPIGACAALEMHQPSVFAGVPSLYASLVRAVSPIRQIKRESIRLLISTGAPFHPQILIEVQALFDKANMSLNYGLTETYRTTSFNLGDHSDKLESVGKPVEGVYLRILRGDGTEAPAGEIGQVIHGGEGVFLGYWGESNKTEKILMGDPCWKGSGSTPPKVVFTGDMGYLDDDGFLYLKGRHDRQIKSMGVRVSPDEVENILLSNTLVSELAVTSLPHDILGEMVVAALVYQKQLDNPIKAMKKIALKSMSPNMRPREYHVLESLPRTASGKVDYPKLREVIEGLRASK